MSTSVGKTTEVEVRLLPHQQAFVDTIFRADGKRVVSLQAPAGYGKSSAIVAAVDRLLDVRPISHVLLLTSKAAGAQYADRLKHSGVKAFVADRYRFRELRTAVTHGQLWPDGVVAILSLDFAKQLDVLETLAMVPWDLVIVDELERFGRAGMEALLRIGAAAQKVVLATRMPLAIFPQEDVEHIQWRRNDLVDQSGQALAGPRPVLERAPYLLTDAERSLAATVEGLCFSVEAAVPHAGEMVAKSLRSALLSSPAALESNLNSLATEEFAIDSLDLIGDDESGELPGGDSQNDEAVVAVPGIVDLATAALGEVESLLDDSKVARLIQLITKIKQEENSGARRVCVLTKYVSTMFYVAAALEGAQVTASVMQGGDNADERVKSLELFSHGDVLLTTHAAMRGFEPPDYTTDLVLYDLPSSAEMAWVLVSRFDRLRRQTALDVHVLMPENLAHPMLQRGAEYIQRAFEGETATGDRLT